jgi:hypothetical protein
MGEPIACRRVRGRLQGLRDSGGIPDAATTRHLDACRSCADFRSFLSKLGPALKESAESLAAAQWEPDYRRILEEGRTRIGLEQGRRFLRVAPAAAACLLVAVLGTAVLIPPEPVVEATLSQNVEAFVDSLFRY